MERRSFLGTVTGLAATAVVGGLPALTEDVRQTNLPYQLLRQDWVITRYAGEFGDDQFAIASMDCEGVCILPRKDFVVWSDEWHSWKRLTDCSLTGESIACRLFNGSVMSMSFVTEARWNRAFIKGEILPMKDFMRQDLRSIGVRDRWYF